LSDESKLRSEEIERQRREATSKRANVDYDQLQAKRNLILAARTDTPEEFQIRMKSYGIDLNSERGNTVMEAYWAIRRESQR